MNGVPAVIARLSAVPTRDVGLPTVALAELLYGAHRSRRQAENLARIEQLKGVFTVLPLDEAVADHYGEVRAALQLRGIGKSDFDLVIACTATVAEATLVTHDQGLLDSSIANLSVEDWLDGPR